MLAFGALTACADDSRVERVCEGDPGSLTDVAGEPPLWRFPHYTTWTTTDGCIVRVDAITDRPGPEHCGWQASRVIVTGRAIGDLFTSPADSAQYVRDPNNVYGDAATSTAFDPDAELPPGAHDTGLRSGDTELWVVPTDPSAIYLRTGDRVERWPRDDDVPLCA